MQPITLSAEQMILCRLPLSLGVAAFCMVMKEVRMDSMMTVNECTIIVFGKLNFCALSVVHRHLYCFQDIDLQVVLAVTRRSISFPSEMSPITLVLSVNVRSLKD